MNAAQFYQAFEHAFLSQSPPALQQQAGQTSRWMCKTVVGDLTFAFATNPKTAGLLPHLPGEFRLTINWSHKAGNARRKDEVAFFQYAADEDCGAYAKLQRQVLDKFLSPSPETTGAGGCCGRTVPRRHRMSADRAVQRGSERCPDPPCP